MNLGNRNSQKAFATVPNLQGPRSVFNRSFAAKDTMDFDDLVPFFVDEILPGDTINLGVKMFARLATQVVPLMDNMYTDTYFFFVPMRIVWDNFEKFMGQQDTPGASTDYLIPALATGATFTVGTIYDKMGLPTNVANITTQNRINALPFRAYNLIRNDWFRDENLQTPLTVLKTDGPDPVANYSIVKGAKQHDYFTSALPWPQKGDAVTLPLGTTAPVIGIGKKTQVYSAAGVNVYETGSTTLQHYDYFTDIDSGANDTTYYARGTANPGYPNIVADLSAATAATINQLRLAFLMQSVLELDARSGTRYPEVVQGHFGVTVPDFRVQRPELLSVARTFLAQHIVAQTSESATTPQGTLSAYSTAAEVSGRVGFSKSFVEHGYVIGLMRTRGDQTYQQGLNKMWSKSTRWDLMWPKLQQLGEQAILLKEIYAQGTVADETVFGYQERYAEYRYMPSQIRGQFRSTFAQSLDVWHLAEEFGSAPALNSTFIVSNTPIERSLEVPDPAYPHLLVDFFFDYKHARRMMTYGMPASLGRF